MSLAMSLGLLAYGVFMFVLGFLGGAICCLPPRRSVKRSAEDVAYSGDDPHGIYWRVGNRASAPMAKR